jgi:type VI secretion system protein ImpK
MSTAATAASAPNFATCYQEILTVTARLRTRKFAVTDSASFRTQVRKALQLAESSAQTLRYEQDDVRFGSYAIIALLDETIFNSNSAAFRDWAQKPLMLDLYGTVNAGEGFFENLSSILKRRESRATIDLLEVYLLCLMLGFRGRYSSGSGEQLHARENHALPEYGGYGGAFTPLDSRGGHRTAGGLQPVDEPRGE